MAAGFGSPPGVGNANDLDRREADLAGHPHVGAMRCGDQYLGALPDLSPHS
ncbi:hypothetical protein [Nonomuraea sp. NEAU-A123]|uniref:hypothetical protein n=1 Tax=Nonomuraea sp. NEAU-A123 TaxID=2839649 RepID=UPI001BE43D1C|nr:hypothetical protein [Nonomuraea sp. NEAU-A123]MBT2231668.1 hypothetical protein [Nonomuraea sp. NEAU-A123]